MLKENSSFIFGDNTYPVKCFSCLVVVHCCSPCKAILVTDIILGPENCRRLSILPLKRLLQISEVPERNFQVKTGSVYRISFRNRILFIRLNCDRFR